jgi:hypothetical protein
MGKRRERDKDTFLIRVRERRSLHNINLNSQREQ